MHSNKESSHRRTNAAVKYDDYNMGEKHRLILGGVFVCRKAENSIQK